MTTTAAEHIERTRQALARSNAFVNKCQDWTGWPADVVELGELFCKLYTFRPPRTMRQKAFWIQSLRELQDAAGEYGHRALVEQRREFVAQMVRNGERTGQRTAPFTVDSPKSLVNAVRGAAARMRENHYVVQECTGYDEGNPYTTGYLAEYIEH